MQGQQESLNKHWFHYHSIGQFAVDRRLVAHLHFTTPRNFHRPCIKLTQEKFRLWHLTTPVISRQEKIPPLVPYHPCFLIKEKIPHLAPYHRCCFKIGKNPAIGTIPLLLLQHRSKFRNQHLTTNVFLVQENYRHLTIGVNLLWEEMLSQALHQPNLFLCKEKAGTGISPRWLFLCENACYIYKTSPSILKIKSFTKITQLCSRA